MPKVNEIRKSAVIFVNKTFTSHRKEILFMISVRKEAASQIQQLKFIFSFVSIYILPYYIALFITLLLSSKSMVYFLLLGMLHF